jgi:hypothetical protein
MEVKSMTKILCVADDEYIKKYKPCIESQIEYAKRTGYQHVLISGEKESRNWKRSKIDELMTLLETTSDDVILIDADCLIKDSCPKFTTFVNDQSIYYANGKSGRLNSGFLYFKNDQNSLNFLYDLKEKLKLTIPRGKGYFVTKEGENGHIIWLKDEYKKSGKDIFQEIPRLWNCSSPSLKEDAYILHFTNDLKKEIYKYK